MLCFCNICETFCDAFICIYFSTEKEIPTPVMEKFAVKFQIYTKIIKVNELALVYDKIKRIFSFLKTFPENFIVKYEDKDLGYLYLDSPIELANSLAYCWLNQN